MATVLSWLAAGVAVGLAVRFLAPDHQYLGITRAIALGVAGAGLGGLLGSGLFGAGDASGGGALAVWIVSAAGAWVVPWMYLAYGVRWDVPVDAPARGPAPVG